jgi:hypothetical protein
VALLEKRRYLNNRSGDFPQVILIVPSHVPNNLTHINYQILAFADHCLPFSTKA